MLKSKYAPNDVHTFNSLLQYYDGEADMPGGLSRADYNADRWQSTRPHDRFWGAASWQASAISSSRTASINSIFRASTETLRSGYRNRANASPFHRVTTGYAALNRATVRALWWVLPRTKWAWDTAYVSESTHEMRYYTATSNGQLPSSASPYDRDTRSGTEARTPGIWMTKSTLATGLSHRVCALNISSHTRTTPSKAHEEVSYNAPLPALNVLYHLTDSWNLYANTEGSFGTVQYSQIGKAVQSSNVEPEKARTRELGTRYDDGALTAEMGLFLINFNNQYDSTRITTP